MNNLMKTMNMLWLVIGLLFSQTVLASAGNKFVDVGDKTFTLVQEYHYSHFKYQDIKIENFEPEFRDVNEGADRQLVSFLSAIKHDDFAWWLNIWDQETQNNWQDRITINKAQRAYQYWQKQFPAKAKVELKDYVVLGQRVFVGVLITSGASREYHLMPFVLENGRWRLNDSFTLTVVYQKLREHLTSS